jgi:hypothetical protein
LALTDDALPGDAELALRSIVTAATALFPVAGAGVMLTDSQETPRWVTTTDPLAQAFEDAQAMLGQGPCINVLRGHDLLWSVDVTNDARWPELGGVLAGKGILMARHGIDQDEAWTRLREASRITRRRAVDLASEIVAGKALPPPDELSG